MNSKIMPLSLQRPCQLASSRYAWRKEWRRNAARHHYRLRYLHCRGSDPRDVWGFERARRLNFCRSGLFVSGQRRYRSSVGTQFNLAVVVDDDPDIGLAARLALRDLFERVETLDSPAALLPLLKEETPDAILLDLNFERSATDGREGLDYLARIMEQDPDSAVVIITAHGAVSIAVEAIKRGASDFVAKPWSNE